MNKKIVVITGYKDSGKRKFLELIDLSISLEYIFNNIEELDIEKIENEKTKYDIVSQAIDYVSFNESLYSILHFPVESLLYPIYKSISIVEGYSDITVVEDNSYRRREKIYDMKEQFSQNNPLYFIEEFIHRLKSEEENNGTMNVSSNSRSSRVNNIALRLWDNVDPPDNLESKVRELLPNILYSDSHFLFDVLNIDELYRVRDEGFEVIHIHVDAKLSSEEWSDKYGYSSIICPINMENSFSQKEMYNILLEMKNQTATAFRSSMNSTLNRISENLSLQDESNINLLRENADQVITYTGDNEKLYDEANQLKSKIFTNE